MLALAAKLYDKQSTDYALVLQSHTLLDNRFANASSNLKSLLLVDDILQKQLGKNHLKVADNKKNLAFLYGFTLYDAENSLKFAQQAYKIYFDVYGEAFPFRVSLENTIASAYLGLEQFDKALEHYELGIEMERNHFSNLPVRIANLEYNMASIYLEHLHDYHKAISYYEKVIPIAAKNRGRNSYHYHFKRLNYAKALSLVGKGAIAEEYLNETITLFEERKKNEKLKSLYVLARAKTFLAQILIERNELCSAHALILQALPDFLKIVGEDNDAYIEANEVLILTEAKLNGKTCDD
jgi:tetratricopeptide (TPR) repeat protein